MLLDRVKTGQRIKAIRLQIGKSQETFGTLFYPSVSKGAVSRWETGNTIPNTERLKRIADLGHVSVDFLLHGSTTSNPEIVSLLNKIKKGTQLSDSELEKLQESSIETNISSAKNDMEHDPHMMKQIDDQAKYVEENPLSPERIEMVTSFFNLLIFVNKNGSVKQNETLTRVINGLNDFVSGKFKYTKTNKNSLHQDIDELIFSFHNQQS